MAPLDDHWMDVELNLLEYLCASVDVEFDVAAARAAILRSGLLATHGRSESPLERLEQAARPLGVRITRVRQTTSKVLRLLETASPLVAWAPAPGSTLPSESLDHRRVSSALRALDGLASHPEGRWIFVTARRGRYVLLSEYPAEKDSGRWVSQGELTKVLGLDHPDLVVEWGVVTPLVPCDMASESRIAADIAIQNGEAHGTTGGAGEHHAPLRWPNEDIPPLSRLFRLLKPEWIDIKVVFAFAVGVGLLSLATPLAVESLVTAVAFNRLYQQLVVLTFLLLGCLGFAAAMRALQTLVVEIIQQRLFVRVVADLAHRLPHVEREATDLGYGPETVNRFFDIVTVQKVVAQLLLDGIALILTTLASLVILAFYHPFLLGFDLVFLALMVIFVFLLGRGAIRTSIQESMAKYAVAGWLEDIARLPIAFKSERGMQLALERADGLCRRYLTMRKAHFRILFRQILFAVSLQALAGGALLGLGGWLVMSGQLTLGQLVAAELMVTTIAGSFAKLGKHLEGYYDLMASVNKLGMLFDVPIESPRGEIQHRLTHPAALRLSDLSYVYLSSHHPVFSGLNVVLPPGDSLAVIGPPGSGKSTLAELLFALRKPTGGRIEWDGIDIRELELESLRDQIGFVQNLEIFEGTIVENLRAGRYELSLEEVRRALDQVGLLEEILELPEGMHTRLSRTGAPLSTTQLVRLMVARAIASRPRLLVIDQLLDLLAPHERRELMRSLADRSNAWTFVVTTNHLDVVEACEHTLQLASPDGHEANSQLRGMLGKRPGHGHGHER